MDSELKNSRTRRSKIDDNKKKQMIIMFFNKISEDLIVIHSKLYVRFRITKPASEKSPYHCRAHPVVDNHRRYRRRRRRIE